MTKAMALMPIVEPLDDAVSIEFMGSEGITYSQTAQWVKL